jgi:hypothetical protein
MHEPTFLHVFMSYRREDAAGYAGRLYDSLTSRLDVADVFMDVGDIEPGVDFTDAIAHAVERTDVMLALIGPRWTTAATPEGRRRLDDPDDYVVAEIGEALERDVRVIPVLLENTPMPTANDLPDRICGLTRRNAIELSTVSWRSDVDALVDALHRLVPLSAHSKDITEFDTIAAPEERALSGKMQRGTRRPMAWTAVTVAIAAVVVTAAIVLKGDDPGLVEQYVIEAESGTLSSPMGIGSDPSASGGRFVVSPERESGAVQLTLALEGGVYVVWARAAAGSDEPARSDSFFVEFDGGDSYHWDLFHKTGNPPTNWTWERVSARCGGDFDTHLCDPLTFELESGEHQLSFLTLEPGSKLDMVVITNDLDGRPSAAE